MSGNMQQLFNDYRAITNPHGNTMQCQLATGIGRCQFTANGGCSTHARGKTYLRPVCGLKCNKQGCTRLVSDHEQNGMCKYHYKVEESKLLMSLIEADPSLLTDKFPTIKTNEWPGITALKNKKGYMATAYILDHQSQQKIKVTKTFDIDMLGGAFDASAAMNAAKNLAIGWRHKVQKYRYIGPELFLQAPIAANYMQ